MPRTDQVPLLLTIEEVQTLLHLGRTTVKELVRAGALQSLHIGRAVRIPADGVARFIAARTTGGDALAD